MRWMIKDFLKIFIFNFVFAFVIVLFIEVLFFWKTFQNKQIVITNNDQNRRI